MEDSILIAALVILGIVVPVIFHFLSKNYLYASTAAAMFSSLILLVADYLILGYLDPFFIFGFPAAVLIYFLVALAIGVPFAVVRKRRGERVLIPLQEDKRRNR